MSKEDLDQLETFSNPFPDRDYAIHIKTREFTCLCPKTGQPDFATFTIHYIPDTLCIELKALKLYMFSYRDTGEFHETITNKVLNDIVRACSPRFIRVNAQFNIRGGLQTTVIAEDKMDGWNAPESPVFLTENEMTL